MLSIQRKQRSSTPAQVTPLVNLFAYIRDLFTTVKPSLRFDTKDTQWWPLMQLLEISQDELVNRQDNFHFQLKNPEKPLLTVQRGEHKELPHVPHELREWIRVIEESGQKPRLEKIAHKESKFEEVASRIKAFREFKREVDGKTLEEVSHLHIPPALNPWVALTQEDGKIFVDKLEQAEEHFQDDELRKELFVSYQRSFDHHIQEQANFQQINRLYDALHDLYFQLQSHQDRQITLSFGLVQGKIGGEAYKNYLFHLPLKLSLSKQELILEADTFTHLIHCEQNFTELLDKHFEGEAEEKTHKRKLKILQEVDKFNTDSRELNFEPDYLRGSFYATAIRILEVFPKIDDHFFEGKELNYALPLQAPTEHIQFSFSPVIQTRLLNTGAHVAQDADRIIKSIHELGTQDENGKIPDFFKKLFSLRKPGNPLRIAYKSMAKEASNPVLHESDPDRFLFPLPYNKEQLSIAQQLTRQDAVTVQGPPGTGKSHTIANLTAHFVAEGKSILIVSKNAKALEVIRNKLPGDIKQLVVSFLKGNEHQEVLRSSIDAVKDNLSRKYEEGEITRRESELSALEADLETCFEAIQTQIRAQHKKISLLDPHTGKERSSTLMEWVKELAELEEVSVIQDRISPEQNTEGWADKLLAVQTYLQAHEEPAYEVSEDWVLPNRTELQQLFEELDSIERQPKLWSYQNISLEKLDDEFLLKLQEVPLVHKEMLSSEELLKQPSFKLQKLVQVLHMVRPIFQNYEEEEKVMMRYEIKWGELQDLDPDQGVKEIRSLFEKYTDSGKLGILKKKFLNEIQKAFFSCSINGLEVKGLDELVVLERSMVQAARLKQIHILLNNFAKTLGLLVDKEAVETTFESWSKVESAIQRFHVLNQHLEAAGLEKLSHKQEQREGQIDFLSSLPLYKKYQLKLAQLNKIKQEAENQPELQEIITRRDLPAFDLYAAKLESAKLQNQDRRDHQHILEEVQSFAPQTLEFLQANPDTQLTREQIHQELLALKVHALLDRSTHQLEHPNEKIEELRSIKDLIQQKTIELIAYKTWYYKQKQIGDQERSALSAWRNDLVNIGKGHGKNAQKNMKSAVHNMQLAKEVVPVWIMQQDTAISFFPDPTPGQFDLLIVDEASQCDISMLNLIYRCKKCIIVGDENQTAVATQARMFPLARTNQLLDRYLLQHPFKQQFNINNRSSSVYSLSGVIYPNIISLREHFRCRPELIGFSNKYVYDQQIIPLRTATDNHYGSAAEVHYIEDDPKNPKKPAIVKACVQLVSGLIEDVEAGRLAELPSLGILCLDSSNEDHRDLLVRELHKHPQIKAHREELKLLVGTSREFQGDERDIMILTTTASHSFTAEGKIKAPRSVMGEEMSRIYNVAASRARDKAILLHSIHPEALSRMKPDCFRKRLIDYFGLQMMADQQERVLASVSDMNTQLGTMGQELFEVLAEEGYAEQLFPQYKMGPYEIDLAIIRDGLKLAIFVDNIPGSEENLSQQLVLERAGWRCFRVQAVEWSVNREVAWKHLKSWIES